MCVFKRSWHGDLLYVGVSGLISSEYLASIKQQIFYDFTTPVTPFRVMCDLRGLEPLRPELLSELADIERCLYNSNAFKVGTVFDDSRTKAQHLRIVRRTIPLIGQNDGRSKVFSTLDECWAWLMEGEKEGTWCEKRRP